VLVEDLYQNANALPLDYDCIAFDMRCDEGMVKSIINDFGLFVVDADFFGSLSVQRRLEERAEKSEKARQSAFKRWGVDANAMRTQCEPNAIKERKGKEIKEKNIIPPKIEMIKQYCVDRDNNVDADKFFNFYEAKGWVVGKSKMKDWQAAVRTWEEKKEDRPRLILAR
jgi:hypothetical protein